MNRLFLPILLMFSISLYAQTYIHPNTFSNELAEFINNEYKTSSTLGYNSARDTLYLIIDSHNQVVSCIYSDFSVEFYIIFCQSNYK